jgi:hypothetical protein
LLIAATSRRRGQTDREMKPGERPPASPPNDGRLTLTAHWGATPCIKDRPRHGLGLSILDGAAVIPKPIAVHGVTRRGIVEHEAVMRRLADVGYTRAWAYRFAFL